MTVPTPKANMRTAYSYIRFSSRKQADGFSLRRQLEAAQQYCERAGLTLSATTYADLGVSGWKGKNAKSGDLSKFMDLVKEGRIAKGSVLVVENVDRLSREEPDRATALFCSIIRAGVDITMLSPFDEYTAANIGDVSKWIRLQVAIALAAEESRKKSERVGDAWKRKRAALADGKVLTKLAPFWLRLADDRKTWIVDEQKAVIVRQVFAWCVEGLGVQAICRRLQTSHPSGPTGKGGWTGPNISKLIHSRAVLGEFVAGTGRGKNRKIVGAPIVGYHPAIIDEQLFMKAQATTAARTTNGGEKGGRKHGGGKQAGASNLFGGVLFYAADNKTMVVHSSPRGRKLVSSGAVRGVPGSVFRSIPVDVFESAILEKLRELTAADVSGTTDTAADAVATASAKLNDVNRRVEQIKARMMTADDTTEYFDMLDTLTKNRKAVEKELQEAKSRAASPAGEALGECVSLASLLASAEGDERAELRRRTKAAVLRLVERIDVLCGPENRGGNELTKRRTFVARVKFLNANKSRTYVVTYGAAGLKVFTITAPTGMAFDVAGMTAHLDRGAKYLEGYYEFLLERVRRTDARRALAEQQVHDES